MQTYIITELDSNDDPYTLKALTPEDAIKQWLADFTDSFHAIESRMVRVKSPEGTGYYQVGVQAALKRFEPKPKKRLGPVGERTVDASGTRLQRN